MNEYINIPAKPEIPGKGHIPADLPYTLEKFSPLEHPFNRFIKRFVDLTLGGLMALLVLPWLIPLAALLIKMDSPGPVFFVQKRTGRYQKTFHCIKFRTMLINREANRQQVVPDDGRITMVGKTLRAFYIDELPQLLNVLHGSMSLVGPRPHMLRHTVQFSRLISNYNDRHRVKPGMTGLAQMRGYHGMIRTIDDLSNRTASDLEYIANWSLLTDFRIFLLTNIQIIKRIIGTDVK